MVEGLNLTGRCYRHCSSSESTFIALRGFCLHSFSKTKRLDFSSELHFLRSPRICGLRRRTSKSWPVCTPGRLQTLKRHQVPASPPQIFGDLRKESVDNSALHHITTPTQPRSIHLDIFMRPLSQCCPRTSRRSTLLDYRFVCYLHSSAENESISRLQ